MENINSFLIIIIAFIIVATASGNIAKLFIKIKLPLITGFLVIGIIAGPYVTNLISLEAVNSLKFIDDIALAFIAFAAGSELYLKDIRSKFTSITWMTLGQIVATFFISSFIIFHISDYIPFMANLNNATKFAISILIGAIFVARSPASAIAVINELRAKGPFTKIAIGTIIVKDFLAIILFTITFSVSSTLISNVDFNITTIILLFFELVLSFFFGFLIGKLITLFIQFQSNETLKTLIILLVGWGVYGFTYLIRDISVNAIGIKIHFEPLLINIIAAFYITNYSKNRQEFTKIIEEVGIFVYISFFTLTGASIALDIIKDFWFIALILFLIRLFTLFVGSFIASSVVKELALYKKIGWMPFVTQAGVALGLVTMVSKAFPDWGAEFEAIIVAVIIMNLLLGPPIFKASIFKVKENHDKAETKTFDGIRDAIIFGLENQSLALAKQLKEHSWNVKIATMMQDIDAESYTQCEVIPITDYSLETFKKLEAFKAEAIICMQTDEENIQICETAYENCGTKDLIVRLQEHKNYEYFQKIGALVVEPDTSIVNLLFHFVRSPIATSILLGMEENHDTIDLEVINPDLQGIALRDLRLPNDTLILSVKRDGSNVISHGYTRLRLGDFVTMVGSEESLQKVKLKFE
ncbi:MAG: cation:proton antiporter [Bacteroidales bacterium]|nr:cation:proton antiporter [Bacteroidales bacterium]